MAPGRRHLTIAGTTVSAAGFSVPMATDIPVLFSDYNIANPSFAGFVTTQDHGVLEFLLVFNRT